MKQRQKKMEAGIAPGLQYLFEIDGPGGGAKTRFALALPARHLRCQFSEARFGGVAGHDLISVS